MSDICRRGCCWSPYACGTQRNCACHPPTLAAWLGAQEPVPDNVTPIFKHRDPTATKAIRNVMKERGK